MLRPDGDLDWASYEGPDSLVPGPRGVPEPAEPPRGVEAVTRADAVLAPALAVDRRGEAARPGGGSYDRALARVGPLIPVIALLYDDEFLTGCRPRSTTRRSARRSAPGGHHLAACRRCAGRPGLL